MPGLLEGLQTLDRAVKLRGFDDDGPAAEWQERRIS
jgi:hypothetical protein